MIAALLSLSLGTATAEQPAPPATAQQPQPPATAQQPPPPATQQPPPPATIDEPLEKRPFVFTFLTGVSFGLRYVPSLDLAFYFGGRLARRPWTLGYQFTFSSGYADRYIAGFFTHRHHITAMRSFGRRDRGFTSVGGGPAFLYTYLVVEAEARVGLRFGRRARGVVAAQARVGWNIHFREQAPVPMLGLVIGATML